MKHGTIGLLKFKKLQRRLKLELYETIGVLEALWIATQFNAPEGDIGKLDDEEIVISIGWPREAKELIDALVDTGWLDGSEEHRLVVHDWADHAPSWLKGMLHRHGRCLIGEINTGDAQDKDADGDLISPSIAGSIKQHPIAGSARETTQGTLVPNLTQPNLTQPNLKTARSIKPTGPNRSQLARVVFEYQNEVRKRSMPKSRSLKPTDDKLLAISKLLKAGYEVEQLKEALDYRASRVSAGDSDAAKYFTGTHNWSPKAFAYDLGQAESGQQHAKKWDGSYNL